MKIKVAPRIRNVISNVFNVKSWIDFERIKSFTLYLTNGAKTMFVPQKKVAGESFEEAIAKFKVSEEDLYKKQTALYRLSLLMSGAALFIFAYAVYHIFYGNFKAALVSLVLTLLALVFAFRYHFWYFQIKKRKLGCTIKEWYKEGLMSDK
jgi:intracellular multiplication protein IcmV